MSSKAKVRKKIILDKEVGCPFYNRSTARTISCSGLYPTSTIVQHFQNEQEIKIQAEFCKGKYKNCELYRAVIEAQFAGDD